MSTQRADVHPITAEARAPYRAAVERRMSQVAAQGATHNLVEVLRRLDPEDQFLLHEESLKALRALREALMAYYAVYDLLEKRTGLQSDLAASRADTSADRAQIVAKLTFVGAYSLSVSAAYLLHATANLIAPGREAELANCRVPERHFSFGTGRDEDLKGVLSKYYLALVEASQQDVPVFTTPLDVVGYTRSFFAALSDQARSLCTEQPPELRSDIEGVTFRLDDLEVSGLEIRGTARPPRSTFRTITPEEIVGNEEAKTRLLRYADRLALYDPQTSMNPILKLGGLPWSVFLDGPPGSGKTSLFRLYLTRLAGRAEAAGLPLAYEFIDPSIKDEYYGRTARLLAEKLAITDRRDSLCPLFFDDLDLLLLGDRANQNATGADKDILNLTMQHLDGLRTMPFGNSQTFAATNQPLGTDEALRQRFQDRLLIEGPVTAEHFTRLQQVKLRHAAELGMTMVGARSPGPPPSETKRHGGERLPAEAIFRKFNLKLKERPCWADLGALCEELKRQYPGFSGRTIENAMQTLQVRSADFDIPEEWFESREVFLDQPFERRVAMLRELFFAITGDMIAQELYSHFETERRYAEQQATDERSQLLNRLIRQYEAEQEFQRTLGATRREGRD